MPGWIEGLFWFLCVILGPSMFLGHLGFSLVFEARRSSWFSSSLSVSLFAVFAVCLCVHCHRLSAGDSPTCHLP